MGKIRLTEEGVKLLRKHIQEGLDRGEKDVAKAVAHLGLAGEFRMPPTPEKKKAWGLFAM